MARVSGLSVDWFMRNRNTKQLVIGLDGNMLHADEFNSLAATGSKVRNDSTDTSVIEIDDSIFHKRILAGRETEIKHDDSVQLTPGSAGSSGRFIIFKH